MESTTVAGKAYRPDRAVGSRTICGEPTVAVIGNVMIGLAGSFVVILRLQFGGVREVGENLTTKPKQESGLMTSGEELGLIRVKSAQFEPTSVAPVTIRSHLPVSQS